MSQTVGDPISGHSGCNCVLAMRALLRTLSHLDQCTIMKSPIGGAFLRITLFKIRWSYSRLQEECVPWPPFLTARLTPRLLLYEGPSFTIEVVPHRRPVPLQFLKLSNCHGFVRNLVEWGNVRQSGKLRYAETHWFLSHCCPKLKLATLTCLTYGKGSAA